MNICRFAPAGFLNSPSLMRGYEDAGTRGYEDTMMRDSGWSDCRMLKARSERDYSPLPRTALHLVRGYENIVPPACFSVASSQASSFCFCRFFNSQSFNIPFPYIPIGAKPITLHNIVSQSGRNYNFNSAELQLFSNIFFVFLRLDYSFNSY